MGWLRKWWGGKIQINITYITEGVYPTTTPRDEPIVVIKRSNKSNLRFKSQENKEHDGTTRIYYFTEEYKNGRWNYINNSFFADKNEAMEIHLKLLQGEDFETRKFETVLWEGLSKEEAETWIGLQKNDEQ